MYFHAATYLPLNFNLFWFEHILFSLSKQPMPKSPPVTLQELDANTLVARMTAFRNTRRKRTRPSFLHAIVGEYLTRNWCSKIWLRNSRLIRTYFCNDILDKKETFLFVIVESCIETIKTNKHSPFSFFSLSILKNRIRPTPNSIKKTTNQHCKRDG